MLEADLIVRNASFVATCTGRPTQGGQEAVGLVAKAAVAAKDGSIVWVGAEADLDAGVRLLPSGRTVDAEEGIVGPGYVDAHTHLVFAGDRSEEFSRRCGGASYQEILAAGGGILATVRATRSASEEELVALARPRALRLISEGVTTVEIKSGYGLTVEDELKMLRAIRRLGSELPVSVIATALPLHALPPEAKEDRQAWVDRMIEELLPVVAEEGLARFADVFVESGAFTADEARRLARVAGDLGLGVRLHVDQLTSGKGSELAAELGAFTADHLEEVSEVGIRALADARVTVTLLPTSTLYLKCPRYAPGRALADAGVSLALGSNCNPGSAMSESFSLALSLACLGNGLTAQEAFFAATRGGALALGLEDRGTIAPGTRADLVVHGTSSLEHLAYHMAASHARVVIAGGAVIHENHHLPALCS